MAPRCRGHCNRYEGYTVWSGRNLYKNDIIFCKLCECAYRYRGIARCKCCGGKIRTKSFYSHSTAKAKKKTAIEVVAH